MKKMITALLVAASLLPSGCIMTTSLPTEQSAHEKINLLNFTAIKALRGHSAMMGRVVSAEQIQVNIVPDPSILGMVIRDIPDAILGTRTGIKRLPAWQYVIRMDNPTNRPAFMPVMTVIQEHREPIPVGSAVAVTWTGYTTGINVVMLKDDVKETYMKDGWEEERYWDKREENIGREVRAFRDAVNGDQ